MWLTHTWKCISEKNLKVYLDIPPLMALYKGEFIMERFWKVWFSSKVLAFLNWCQMWLQVITILKIADGAGTSVRQDFLYGKRLEISPIHSFLWPKVIEPENHLWHLCNNLESSRHFSTMHCLVLKCMLVYVEVPIFLLPTMPALVTMGTLPHQSPLTQNPSNHPRED